MPRAIPPTALASGTGHRCRPGRPPARPRPQRPPRLPPRVRGREHAHRGQEPHLQRTGTQASAAYGQRALVLSSRGRQERDAGHDCSMEAYSGPTCTSTQAPGRRVAHTFFKSKGRTMQARADKRRNKHWGQSALVQYAVYMGLVARQVETWPSMALQAWRQDHNKTSTCFSMTCIECRQPQHFEAEEQLQASQQRKIAPNSARSALLSPRTKWPREV